MADIVTSSSILSIVAEFTDGDDRTISMPNPKAGLSWADVEVLNSSASNVLIGDRAQANFYRIKDAKVKETTTIHYDLQ